MMLLHLNLWRLDFLLNHFFFNFLLNFLDYFLCLLFWLRCLLLDLFVLEVMFWFFLFMFTNECQNARLIPARFLLSFLHEHLHCVFLLFLSVLIFFDSFNFSCVNYFLFLRLFVIVICAVKNARPRIIFITIRCLFGVNEGQTMLSAIIFFFGEIISCAVKDTFFKFSLHISLLLNNWVASAEVDVEGT